MEFEERIKEKNRAIHMPFATLIIAIIADTSRNTPDPTPTFNPPYPILLAIHRRVTLMTRGALPAERKIMNDRDSSCTG